MKILIDVKNKKQLSKIKAALKLIDVNYQEVEKETEKILIEQNSEFKPMSLKEFNDRIDKSENDFKNGKYKSTSELINKYN